jgi:hypothetical protein
MEVTKKEVRGEGKEVKRPEIDSAIIVYPGSEIQTCIVHLIRNSLSFCNWKGRKPARGDCG